jgi:predicted nuclease of predicted toxin-antitoxin system
VRLLIDAQLPPRLRGWFDDQGVDASHVMDIENGLRLPDVELWRIAKEERQIIVTKDMDFYGLSTIYGSPPSVLILRYGNCSNATMIRHLSRAWPVARDRLADNAASLILLYRDSVEIYPS